MAVGNSVVILLLVASFWRGQAQQLSCSNSGPRENCGYVGITQEECESRLCCWNPVNPNPSNDPYCFFQNGPTPVSPVCDDSRNRINCGYVGIDQQTCEDQGCCWAPVNPNPSNIPYCFFTNPVLPGYQVQGSLSSTQTGLQGTIVARSDNTENPYGTNISPLSLDVEYETANRIHVKLADPNEQRWEVPENIWPRPNVTSAASNPDYTFSYTSNPFGFAITRKFDGAIVFNTSITSMTNSPFNGLQYADQYLEISSQMESGNAIYGIMESTQSEGFQLSKNKLYTLWNRDTPASVTNQNLYGSHPFYLAMNPNGNAHGVFLLNSNGMDVMIGSDYITYKVIGGVLDFYFFTGPTPDDVVKQYNEVIGLPYFPPYWSMGFHQSRYGMPNIQYLEQVVYNYSQANIPLDTMWSDIDYMDAYKDFTWDPVNYPLNEVQNFTAVLHSRNQHYVPIIDPGIYIDNQYAPYNDMINADVYIRDNEGNPFVGNVWPGDTIFTDFLNPGAPDYWYSQLSTFLNSVPYDGFWIDMNEISNFCTGECPPPNAAASPRVTFTTSASRVKRAQSFNPNDPPYAINNGGAQNPLDTKTLAMDAQHTLPDNQTVLEYNCHNLYGFTESIYTRESLEKYYNKRAFVLSRSTFAGSGHHVAHWTGDNESQWSNLYYALVGMLNFNLLGIPNIGSDICGFNDDTTMELCTRWIEFGAFSPFCRNHDSIDVIPQELYRWPQTANASRVALRIRYSILPLYYTLFYKAHTEGSALARSMMFQYPTDLNTWTIDTQFLIGDAIMVVPVITEGATSVNAYFPDDVFYDYYNHSRIAATGYSTLNAPLEFVNVFFRGGAITPHQYPELTTAATRLNNMNLYVALGKNGTASGNLFWDDGESLTSVSSSAYLYLDFSASYSNSAGQVQSKVMVNGYPTSLAWDNITVLGVTAAPSSVKVNGATFPFSYSGETLDVGPLKVPLTSSLSINWS